MLPSVGKALLLAGVLLALAGAWILFTGRWPSPPSWLGRLPGDVSFERRNVRVYLPVTTSLLLSIALTLLIWLIGRR